MHSSTLCCPSQLVNSCQPLVVQFSLSVQSCLFYFFVSLKQSCWSVGRKFGFGEAKLNSVVENTWIKSVLSASYCLGIFKEENELEVKWSSFTSPYLKKHKPDFVARPELLTKDLFGWNNTRLAWNVVEYLDCFIWEDNDASCTKLRLSHNTMSRSSLWGFRGQDMKVSSYVLTLTIKSFTAIYETLTANFNSKNSFETWNIASYAFLTTNFPFRQHSL